jgi:transposase
MLVIGCDFHPSWQQVCWVDTITGETEEKKLVHGSGEAERFYRQLSGPALIGMESTGNASRGYKGGYAFGYKRRRDER